MTSMQIKRVLVFIIAVTVSIGAATAAPKANSYTCSDGTRLQATFSPPAPTSGSVKLVMAQPPTEMTLPQVLSADGGRYAQGDVEFWIKGQGATLTRAGKQTTCRTRS